MLWHSVFTSFHWFLTHWQTNFRGSILSNQCPNHLKSCARFVEYTSRKIFRAVTLIWFQGENDENDHPLCVRCFVHKESCSAWQTPMPTNTQSLRLQWLPCVRPLAAPSPINRYPWPPPLPPLQSRRDLLSLSFFPCVSWLFIGGWLAEGWRRCLWGWCVGPRRRVMVLQIPDFVISSKIHILSLVAPKIVKLVLLPSLWNYLSVRSIGWHVLVEKFFCRNSYLKLV
jgi:hypothetical protein